MANFYTIILELMDEKAFDIDFESSVGKDKVGSAVDCFNQLQTKNPKRIINWESLGKHRLRIELSSEEILQVPTRAIATFTRKLIEFWPEVGKHAVGRRIFRGLSSEEIRTDITWESIEDISDVNVLKLMVDLVVNKSSIDSREMRLRMNTIEEIKVCLLRYLKEGGSARG